MRTRDQTASASSRWQKLICLMAAALLGVKGQGITEIYEQDINSGLTLGDKSAAYYQMTISDRYFTGKENLAIKVIMEDFESDPDIFISRVNQRPSSSIDSEWYCVKKGSDTCIIRSKEMNV